MLYFAYGSNLSTRGMRARCPAAVPLGKAVLTDHRLVFRLWADVEPCPGQNVQGVLWVLSDACERALDLYEDVAGGLYRRGTGLVRRPDPAAPGPALVYRMNRTDYEAPLDEYLASIEAGYLDFGLDGRCLGRAVADAR